MQHLLHWGEDYAHEVELEQQALKEEQELEKKLVLEYEKKRGV